MIPLVEPGQCIASIGELAEYPTKKFRLRMGGHEVEAFLVHYKGNYFAYRNQCRHAGTPLDWMPNEFFDETGDLLLCRTHGALYEPKTGLCTSGPCVGKRLEEIPVKLSGKEILLAE